ncbi:hypothetical protein GOV10_06360 [Candidatus Woesearchaeota archaeon]|nr:hypothetical protein [Candidatus Woesearchaeota archaeon]
MTLNKLEKKVAHDIIKQHLKQYQKEGVHRDVPVNFLKAEQDYETFLKELLKKFV